MFFRKIISVFLLLPLILIDRRAYSWHQTVQVNFTIEPPAHKSYFTKDEVRIFESTYGSRDYFALLSMSNRNNYFDLNDDNKFVFIGARNHLYQLSVPDLTPTSYVRWVSSQIDKMKCINRSVVRNKDECDNFVKLFLKLNANTVKICSTNGLNPKCRYYHEVENGPARLKVINETSGVAYSPLKAFENKYFYHHDNQTGYIYTGNAIDLNRYFSSVNRLGDQDRLTTNVDDNNWIYRAEFVKSFSDQQRMFIIFNEDKVNDESGPHNQVAPKIPRIAHLCLNDRGASLNSLRNIWTTFLKSKLVCSYDTAKNQNTQQTIDQIDSLKLDESSSIFYFDEIKSISELFRDARGETYFYASFSTSSNQITASAICRFSMSQIMSSFHGPYRGANSDADQLVPDPRPSECPSKLTYQHLVFSRKHFVMDRDVESEALIVETARESQFVSIDVDFNVASLDNTSTADLIFIGTDNGKILVLSVQTDRDTLIPRVVYSEQLNLFDENGELEFNATKNSIAAADPDENTNKESARSEIITNLKHFRNESTESYLIVVTKNRVVSLPWRFCGLKTDASRCNNSIYPYCVWFNGRCFNSNGVSMRSETKWNQTFENEHLKNMNQQVNQSDFISPGLITKLTELSSFNSYTIRNNEITISMNLALFSTILILLLIFSIIFAVLLFLAISDKMSKRSPSAPASSDFNLDSLKELFSFFQSSSPSTKKVFSVDVHDERALGAIDCAEKPERYVSLNPSKPLHLNLADLVGQSNQASKFLDYDQTEYFSLKKKKQSVNDLIKLESATSSSFSSSSPKSTGTSSSAVSVTKSTFVNNDDSMVSSRNICSFENGINKYYL